MTQVGSMYMLNGHKSKMDFETSPPCGVCQVKEIPSYYLLQCNKFKKVRKDLLSNISSISTKIRLLPKMSQLRNCWESKISANMTLKLSEKKLKNTLLPLTMNFENLILILFCSVLIYLFIYSFIYLFIDLFLFSM